MVAENVRLPECLIDELFQLLGTACTDLKMNNTNEIVSQLSGYGSLIVNSLYFMLAGMLVIFLLYKIAHRYLYVRIKGKRLVTVIFGTLYALVFVVTG